jgi:hypothetical protein
MSSYPKCRDLGLEIEYHPDRTVPHMYAETGFIKASEVEKLLGEGVEVTGNKMSSKSPNNWAWDSEYTCDQSTHTGLVINIKPIEKPKPVTKAQIIAEIEKLMDACKVDFDETHELLNAIRTLGIEGE